MGIYDPESGQVKGCTVLTEEPLVESVDELPASPPASDAEFEADLQAFAEGTDHLPDYSGTYSRADIYFDQRLR